MKTKVVYSFISSPDDYYLEQLILSVTSLKKYNPDAFIEIVTDSTTERGFIGWRAKIRQMVNNITVVDMPREFNNMVRSRFLKTRLRSLVKGNYLFMDTDTIICGDLSSVDDLRGDLMMVADCNDSISLRDNDVVNKCKKAGFDDMYGKPYYNSGVIFVKDSKVCHEFYDEWHSNWVNSMANGVNFDQPSMNYTNHKFNDIIQELPGLWNCQIYFNGFHCLHNANVIHYAGGGGNARMLEIYKVIRTEDILPKLITDYIRRPRTSFYLYLTSNDLNIKNRMMLIFKIKNPRLYKLIAKLT